MVKSLSTQTDNLKTCRFDIPTAAEDLQLPRPQKRPWPLHRVPEGATEWRHLDRIFALLEVLAGLTLRLLIYLISHGIYGRMLMHFLRFGQAN